MCKSNILVLQLDFVLLNICLKRDMSGNFCRVVNNVLRPNDSWDHLSGIEIIGIEVTFGSLSFTFTSLRLLVSPTPHEKPCGRRFDTYICILMPQDRCHTSYNHLIISYMKCAQLLH